jgi:hypothetical protein
MRNLTLTIHFCDISQSFVSATKYENTSTRYAELVVQMRPATTLVVSLVVPCDACGTTLRHSPLVKRSRRRHIINRR